jgi:hypothetical protein
VKARAYGVLAFIVAAVVPSLLLSLALLAQNPARPDMTGDMLLALWYLAVVTLSVAGGFVVPIVASKRFAALRPIQATLVGGGLGLVSPIVVLFLPALYAAAVLPLFHTTPWLAAALLKVIPGVFLGLVAVAIAWRLRGAPA